MSATWCLWNFWNRRFENLSACYEMSGLGYKGIRKWNPLVVYAERGIRFIVFLKKFLSFVLKLTFLCVLLNRPYSRLVSYMPNRFPSFFLPIML